MIDKDIASTDSFSSHTIATRVQILKDTYREALDKLTVEMYVKLIDRKICYRKKIYLVTDVFCKGDSDFGNVYVRARIKRKDGSFGNLVRVIAVKRDPREYITVIE